MIALVGAAPEIEPSVVMVRCAHGDGGLAQRGSCYTAAALPPAVDTPQVIILIQGRIALVVACLPPDTQSCNFTLVCAHYLANFLFQRQCACQPPSCQFTLP